MNRPSSIINSNLNTLIQPQLQHTATQRNLNQESQFQKNYPKNVFIPLIEYLADKGYKQAYQQCVGTREQIEHKNVVSLEMLFSLTHEAWFQRNINKKQLLINISNKILMNSKIKKKLFHLLIAQYILLENQSCEIKQFKKNISRMASSISSSNFQTDELFSSSNSIIYLLSMFFKIFRNSIESKGIQKLNQEFNNLKIDEETTDGIKSKTFGSKQEYKHFVKEIVQLFVKKNHSMNQLTDAFEQIKNTILLRADQIRQKYHLIEKIPNWELFIQIVVVRCFQCRRKDGKITNMIFNQWINQYKSKSFCVERKFNTITKQTEIEKDQNQSQQNRNQERKFLPIILTKNY